MNPACVEDIALAVTLRAEAHENARAYIGLAMFSQGHGQRTDALDYLESARFELAQVAFWRAMAQRPVR